MELLLVHNKQCHFDYFFVNHSHIPSHFLQSSNLDETMHIDISPSQNQALVRFQICKISTKCSIPKFSLLVDVLLLSMVDFSINILSKKTRFFPHILLMNSCRWRLWTINCLFTQSMKNPEEVKGYLYTCV